MIGVYSKVLVAYDGSELAEKALKTAMKLAMHDKRIELHVLHIVKPLPTYDIVYDIDGKVNTLLQERAEAMMKGIKESLDLMGNTVVTSIAHGHPEKRIIEYTEKHHCDLIIMGSRGLGGLKELFLGSVSHYVVQHAQVPTLVIK